MEEAFLVTLSTITLNALLLERGKVPEALRLMVRQGHPQKYGKNTGNWGTLGSSRAKEPILEQSPMHMLSVPFRS